MPHVSFSSRGDVILTEKSTPSRGYLLAHTVDIPALAVVQVACATPSARTREEFSQKWDICLCCLDTFVRDVLGASRGSSAGAQAFRRKLDAYNSLIAE